MFNSTTIYAINFYQRYISPHKGFCCAYRMHTGRASCSEYAKKIVSRLGAFALFTAMPRQFARCRMAYNVLMANTQNTDANQQHQHRSRQNRRDYCDTCDCTSDACDACDFLNNKIKILECDSPVNGCDSPCDCSF